MLTPIRWGIVGAGQVAHGFATGLRVLPDAQLVAVASRTAANARAFAHQYGVAHTYSDAAELARNPQIDVVYIATPHHRHLEDSLRCMEQGKAVLCEKPLTINAGQAQTLVEAARHHQRFCMEAMWMRCIPAIRKAHELVQSGAIGDVRMIQADFGVANQVDPKSRFFDLQQGGGALLDLGVYPLSLATLLLGMPEKVTTQAVIGATGVDDQAAIVLGYPHGVLALLSASLRTFSPTEAMIMGSRGTIHIHKPLYAPTRLTITSFSEVPAHGAGSRKGRGLRAMLRDHRLLGPLAMRARQLIQRMLGRGARTLSLPLTGNGYTYEAAEVMRCLRTGALESPLMPLDESVRIMELMDRIRHEWGLRYPGE